jgi:hypothetical protein
MLKLLLFSPLLILWSAIELPKIKKDYSTKGVIYYCLIMILVLTLLSIYLLDIKIPSFYELWIGFLKLFGVPDPGAKIEVE